MTISNGLTLPYPLTDGQVNDAVPLMADLNTMLAALNRALLDGGLGSGINAQGSQIKNLGAGVLSGDAVNLGQLAGYLPLTGGTLTGALAGTSLTLSSALALASGGTGGTDAPTARASLGAAGATDLSALVPSGALMDFAMSTPPTGWLECNGAAVSRSTYAALFAAIGTTYGVGDGSTTFNLPEARGVFRRGWDHGRGTDSGRVFGSTQQSQIQSHKHISGWGSSLASGPFGSVGTTYGSTLNVNSGQSDYLTDDATGAGNPAGVIGSETRPVNLAILTCIKT